MLGSELTEDDVHELYTWVDSMPLSRPKKSISRDFADGVLMAEVVHHYFPRLVELHNYSAAHNTAQKLYNWTTLNTKVFKRLGFVLPKEHYEAVASGEAGAVERVLRLVRAKMAKYQENGGRPGSGQQGTAEAGAAAAADHYARLPQQVVVPPGASQPASPPAGAPPEAVADAIAALHLGSGGKLASGGGIALSVMAGPAEAALKASLADKEQQLVELRETNEILETKIRKLEQLVRLKDAKIQALVAKMAEAGAQ